jgi:hypothetical protein
MQTIRPATFVAEHGNQSLIQIGESMFFQPKLFTVSEPLGVPRLSPHETLSPALSTIAFRATNTP